MFIRYKKGKAIPLQAAYGPQRKEFGKGSECLLLNIRKKNYNPSVDLALPYAIFTPAFSNALNSFSKKNVAGCLRNCFYQLWMKLHYLKCGNESWKHHHIMYLGQVAVTGNLHKIQSKFLKMVLIYL